MTLELSKEEAQVLMQFIDLGLRQLITQNSSGADLLKKKISDSISANEAVPPSAPANPAQ